MAAVERDLDRLRLQIDDRLERLGRLYQALRGPSIAARWAAARARVLNEKRQLGEGA